MKAIRDCLGRRRSRETFGGRRGFSSRGALSSGETIMLGQNNAAVSLAVKDLGRARRFYEEVLGLKPVDEEAGELVTYKSGDSIVNVYRSDFAGTNKATAATWEVDDIEAAVAELKSKGVAFEHYQL